MAQQSQGVADQEEALNEFWVRQKYEIDKIDPATQNWKEFELPLARIKKIMKTDEEADPEGHKFMISAEAPVVFAKACEIFILELTMRAWNLTEQNKRRTLQRNDISPAISKSDQYDFLIDIVPREEMKVTRKEETPQNFSILDPNQILFMQQQLAAAAQPNPQQLQMQQMLWQQQLMAHQAYLQSQANGQNPSAQAAGGEALGIQNVEDSVYRARNLLQQVGRTGSSS